MKRELRALSRRPYEMPFRCGMSQNLSMKRELRDEALIDWRQDSNEFLVLMVEALKLGLVLNTLAFRRGWAVG